MVKQKWVVNKSGNKYKGKANPKSSKQKGVFYYVTIIWLTNNQLQNNDQRSDGKQEEMTTLNTFPKRGRRHSPQTRKRETAGYIYF